MSHPAAAALITGITGQDGAYLAERLLARGVRVTGTHRPGAADTWRLRRLGIEQHPMLRLLGLDLADATAVAEAVRTQRPDLIFHLAGQSRVAESFRQPLTALEANGLSCVHLLEAMREHAQQTHLVLASSAEIFARSMQPLAEGSPRDPRTPYGVSKLLAHQAVVAWRESFRLHASAAILFNHESPLRGESFVTRKIVQAAVRASRGERSPLRLGNLDARRDFGYAPDYVAAMHTMASRAQPGDYVLATGHSASVREFASQAYVAAGIELEWTGAGKDERAHLAGDSRTLIEVDPDLFRPVDAAALTGDAGKARRELGFTPSLDLPALARCMVQAEAQIMDPEHP